MSPARRISWKRGRPAPGTARIAPFLRVLLAFAAPLGAAGPPRFHRGKSDLGEVLSRMNDAAKHLKTLVADLEYTTVTVLVNDRSTESGRMYFRNPKRPELLIDFTKPDRKVIRFNKSKAEIYLPKIERIEEYDLERHAALVQQFLLLGFGTESSELQKAYEIHLIGEQELEGDSTAVLELKPRQPDVASQLTKIQIWVSEDSWLPIQQEFFEPSGDYLIARYRNTKVNRAISSSDFELHPGSNVKRVKVK